MISPKFKIGDRVRFHYDEFHKQPRWNFDTEDYPLQQGEQYIWAYGRAIAIEGNRLLIESELPIPRNSNRWWWPLEGDRKFCSDQWSREGYLRLDNEINLCACELSVIMNIGCQCGGK